MREEFKFLAKFWQITKFVFSIPVSRFLCLKKEKAAFAKASEDKEFKFLAKFFGSIRELPYHEVLNKVNEFV